MEERVGAAEVDDVGVVVAVEDDVEEFAVAFIALDMIAINV